MTIGVSSQLFGSLDFNGTLYVETNTDNDWENCKTRQSVCPLQVFLQIGVVWGMLTINEFYMLISNRQSDSEKRNEIACKEGGNLIQLGK